MSRGHLRQDLRERAPGHSPAASSLQRPPPIRSRAAILSDALVLMEAESPRHSGLDDVARRLASSRRQVQRCFEEDGRGGFRERLAAIRLARAAELLATTSLS